MQEYMIIHKAMENKRKQRLKMWQRREKTNWKETVASDTHSLYMPEKCLKQQHLTITIIIEEKTYH